MGKSKEKNSNKQKGRRASPKSCQNSVCLIDYFGADYADRIFLFWLIIHHRLHRL